MDDTAKVELYVSGENYLWVGNLLIVLGVAGVLAGGGFMIGISSATSGFDRGDYSDLAKLQAYMLASMVLLLALAAIGVGACVRLGAAWFRAHRPV